MEQTATAKEGKIADIQGITEDILGVLDARSKDIVVRRFGLKGDQPETLEKIGKEYHITRERVRQIESNAKKLLAKVKDKLNPVDDIFAAIFTTYGGILTEEHIVTILREKQNQNIASHLVHFYLDILPAYDYVAKSKIFNPHWKFNQAVQPQIEQIAIAAKEVLEEKKHPQLFTALISEIKNRLQNTNTAISDQFIEAALIASKHVGVTAFNEWGLSSWAETAPRGVADKAYTVLRHNNKPAHFRDITKMINETRFDAKKANPQTVHNELIKDSRFVLVGRGLYGLREWGYVTGTVADVLQSILEKAAEPVSKEALIEKVLEQRLVKKNTILLSLQNSKRFTKVSDNKYKLTK